MIKLTTLASGSSGNCLVADINGCLVMFDCGITYKLLVNHIGRLGKYPGEIRHLFITHDHGDHYKASTIKRLSCKIHVQKPYDFVSLNNGGWVLAIPADHDVPCVSYIFSDGQGNKLAYVTDTGTILCDALAYLMGVNGIVVESNHDFDMLINSFYSEDTKMRVSETHLENSQTADLLWLLNSIKPLDFVIASHKSAKNNDNKFIQFELGKEVNCQVQIAEKNTLGKTVVLI